MNLNRGWVDENGEAFGVSGKSEGTTAERAAYFLSLDCPMIIGSNGHATVLTSITRKAPIDMYGTPIAEPAVVSAEIIDPWPENGGLRKLTPNEWNNIMFAATIMVYPDKRLRF